LDKNLQKTSLNEKLSQEVLKILNKKKCISLQLKKQNLDQGLKYRSNAHFR